MSLPSRGAWIEISPAPLCCRTGRSLPSRGAWIEIKLDEVEINLTGSRSPHGERGLK